jgi:hypothetical protein
MNAHSPGRMPSSLRSLAYFIVCQAGWFVCVISAARGAGWLGVIFTILTVLVHFGLARDWRDELKLVLAAVMIGAFWESLLVHTGLLVYPNGEIIPGAAPYWLLGLWALFAIQFNVVYAWLKHRLWLAALLGAVAGPLSFRAGAALGAVRFPDTPAALLALAAGWACLMPGLLILARRWDGIGDGHPQGS